MRAYLADIAGKSTIGSALGLAEAQFTARQIALLYGISVAVVAGSCCTAFARTDFGG